MNSEEFRAHGRAMIDFISDYLETIEKRQVTPNVEPNWLKHQIPSNAPVHPEPFAKIIQDVNEKIMPGITHWQHPNFHGYFPCGASYPSILADMLSSGLGILGSTWDASPSCTELETIVLDWLGKAIGLPEQFLSSPDDHDDCSYSKLQKLDGNCTEPSGGGVLQASSSDCVFVCMMAARAQVMKSLKKKFPNVAEGVMLTRLTAYCSKEAHSYVEKAALMSVVNLRVLDVDEHNSLRGAVLLQALHEDSRLGFVPFFVAVTLGTTSSCSFDNLFEIGPLCRRFPEIWLHVDAAYAGNAFICPEYRVFMRGIVYAYSFNMDPSKWLLVNFDTSCMWVKDRKKLTEFVDTLSEHNQEAIDIQHWGTPESRRFRALKLWFVFRTYGISKLQEHIRRHCALALKFKNKVVADEAFELCNEVKLGLICFRLKDDDPKDEVNKKLLELILKTGTLHMVQAEVQNKYVIRFCINAEHAKEEDIEYAWNVIKRVSTHPEIRDPIDREASHFIKMCAHSRKQHAKVGVGPNQDEVGRVTFPINHRPSSWDHSPFMHVQQDE